MSGREVVFEPCDDSIPHCLFIADGVGLDVYLIYDAVGLDFGDSAEIMRDCLKDDANRFEVRFPNKSRRRYRTLAGAKRSIVAHIRR